MKKKPRVGRPKKDPSTVKNVDLRIPVTDEQKKLVTEAASAAGQDMAAWAREKLITAALSEKK